MKISHSLLLLFVAFSQIACAQEQNQDYQKQVDAYWTQSEETNRQLVKSSQNLKLYEEMIVESQKQLKKQEELLNRWEKVIGRHEKILDKWESKN